MYPRSELLKDQLSELYGHVHRLNQWLQEEQGRKLTIGTYYGSTPIGPTANQVSRAKWAEFGSGYICPLMRCPDCEGILLWRKADLSQGREVLFCKDSPDCSGQVSGDEVFLTRQRVQNNPPDILFTTTEMLNRNLSNGYNAHVFGGNERRHRTILLDEVHTYSGVHGAQVAGLLKRWTHRLGGSYQFTGLSATLPNAREHIANLTGLNVGNIREITPDESRMESEGAEYQIVLRGDPASGASLLSTSIQTCMLIPRMLDPVISNPNASSPSGGYFGSKTFVFTDNLDSTNRLYHDLMDAEALTQYHNPMQNRLPLASLRSGQASDPVVRREAGQNWEASEQIGHPVELKQHLVVGRTSSQDTGVKENANIIIATASLEVGFNDSEVGAVIQHKSPHDPGSFIQRKGRAGRTRLMRPWTVVVLSDYGRDRLSYQAFDLLLSPSLPAPRLPISNRYVLRMQAVFAFFDWLRGQTRGRFDFWGALSRPQANHSISDISSVIREVLTEGSRQDDLYKHLVDALQLDDVTAKSILWEHPRPLMTMVLPTLLRRLETGWGKVDRELNDQQELYFPNQPLPEFVPRALFYDLDLPEVQIDIPGNEQFMGVLQALKEFVPGRVTRRFGISSQQVSHWIPLPGIDDFVRERDPEKTDMAIALSDSWIEYSELDTFYVDGPEDSVALKCVRPIKFKPVQPHNRVNVTSNAQLNWNTDLQAITDGEFHSFSGISAWHRLIPGVSVFTHNQHHPLLARRYSTSATCSLSLNHPSQRFDLNISFVDGLNSDPVGIGFQQEVDGLCFTTTIPEDFRLDHGNTDDPVVRSARTAYFEFKVLSDELLGVNTSTFERDWLSQIVLSAITASALKEDTSLVEALSAVSAIGAPILNRVLSAIFQTLEVQESEEPETNPDETSGQKQRVHERISDLCANKEIRDRLFQLARVLFEEDEGWTRWCLDRVFATLGGALYEACLQISPTAGLDELLLDLGQDRDNPSVNQNIRSRTIWITESNLGGNGIIEDISQRLISDPLLFFKLVESALQATEYEVVDLELNRFLDLIHNDSAFTNLVETIRSANNHDSFNANNESLKKALNQCGILVNHSVISAIYSRILKSGSSQITDTFLKELTALHRSREERIGVEIDPRVFAFIVSQDESIYERPLKSIDNGQHIGDSSWRFQAILSLLWPTGRKIRAMGLDSYNPFAALPETDRRLVLELMRDEKIEVQLSDKDWRTQIEDALKAKGEVILVASGDQNSNLKASIALLFTEPLNIDFMRLYPRVSGAMKVNTQIKVTLQLPEAVV